MTSLAASQSPAQPNNQPQRSLAGTRPVPASLKPGSRGETSLTKSRTSVYLFHSYFIYSFQPHECKHPSEFHRNH